MTAGNTEEVLAAIRAWQSEFWTRLATQRLEVHYEGKFVWFRTICAE